jgi:hypothetical protein
MKRIFFSFIFYTFFLVFYNTAHADYFVNFENESKGSYTSGDVSLNGMMWNMDQSLIGTDVTRDIKNGLKAARLRFNSGIYGSITMLEDKVGGVGNISFLYSRSDFTGDRTGTSPIFVVEYSLDAGFSWIQAGSTIDTSGINSLTQFSHDINQSGDVRIRIKQTGGQTDKRWNIDDILLTDFNNPPTDISISNDNINENVLIPYTVSTISTVDTDLTDTHTYSLSCFTPGVDDSHFNILNSNELTILDPVNFEAKSSYNICIKTTDTGGLFFEKNFLISVNDILENIPKILLSEVYYDSTDVEPNSEWFEIFNPTLSPIDISNWTITDIVSGSAEGTITVPVGTIVNPGQYFVFTHTALNFNLVFPTSSFDFEYGLSQTGDFYMANAGDEINIYDNLGNEVDYVSWEEPNPQRWNDLIANQGESLVRNSSFDTNTSFDWLINQSPNPGSGNLTMIDAPTSISLSQTSMEENKTLPYMVGTLSTIDPTIGDTHTYSFCGGVDDSSFSILNLNELYINTSIDYEAKSAYNICIRAQDSTNLTYDRNFTLNVIDLEERDSYSSGGRYTTPFIFGVTSPTSTTNTIITPTTPTTPTTTPLNTFISPLDNNTQLTCNPFRNYLKLNSKTNNVDEVKLWQAFLNKYNNESLPITGYYGPLTSNAIKRFQLKYKDEILTPWNLTNPTGYTYKTTRAKGNSLLGCSEGELLLDNGNKVDIK